jgi:tRNA(His) guanylyltransferase
MNDELGERMKSQYEHRTRFSLPRRTFTIIRLDGKSFHTYTKGLAKPFDLDLIKDMDGAIIQIMSEIQGAVFAYTQSDEISILVTDFATPNTDAWFDGNIQKIVSVSASLITAQFNRFRAYRWNRVRKANNFMSYHMGEETADNADATPFQLAFFDSRVFTIPDRTEVMNYFIWRNQDCARNSVSMVAQSLFSHKELQGKNTSEMQEMMFSKHGLNWADYDPSLKNGRLIVKETYVSEFNPQSIDISSSCVSMAGTGTTRNRWVTKPAWKFTEDKENLKKMIPQYDNH